jgi:hypothetical protein
LAVAAQALADACAVKRMRREQKECE